MKRNYEKNNWFRLREHLNGRHCQWISGKKKSVATIFFFFLFFLSLVVLVFAGWIDTSLLSGVFYRKSIPKICTQGNAIKTCSTSYPTSHKPRLSSGRSVNQTCPSYFSWIHEDLRPWKKSGVTKDMVKRAKKSAHFKLVIVKGKAYIEKFKQSIQSRDVFSIWGILQLLRYYPGRLPDLELMFDCDDRPVVKKSDFHGRNSRPPPVFRYCSDPLSLDIVFPDWSFWGWAECNIKPWGDVLEDIREGNKRTKWKDRVPYAYWKGNPYVAATRRDLLNCNVSDQNDWNTRLYIQNWDDEIKEGFKQSNLENQCTHRYKIYTEGWAWSVSEKYILACDSMTLYIKSRYHDFFIRGMEPLQHYWPIRENNKCTSLKYAVEWGNNHTDKAQAIGEAASKFMQEDMKMEYIYDYMFHLLNEYGKLFKYKPTVPAGAFELCTETMVCPENTAWRRFMEESLVKSPSEAIPCNLPSDDPQSISRLVERKAHSMRQVQMWEDEYWRNHNNKS